MIIPSIDIQQGRAVQLRRGREKILDGGDPLDRLAELSVVGEVAVIDLDAALGQGSNTELIRRMARRAPCRVGGGIRDLDAARAWLDAGAEKIILGTAATPDLLSRLPAERLIAAVDCEDGKRVVEGWRTKTAEGPLDAIRRLRPLVGGFLLTQVEHEGMAAGFDRALVGRAVEAAGKARVTAAGGITRAAEIRDLERLGTDAQVGIALYSGRLRLGSAFAAGLEKSIAGLWPTVVCDPNGRSLGLVWSSRESVAAAIDRRRGIYWSRSRRQLWVKGETSGATQELLRAELDCDRDALRFTVRQRQGFCHTGERACWPESFGLATLERRIAERADAAPPGSGTARLLSDPALLAAKLSEEAAELAAAETPESAEAEAADLLYFTLTALAARNGGFEGVEAELARRARRVRRRPMAAKPAGAEADR